MVASPVDEMLHLWIAALPLQLGLGLVAAWSLRLALHLLRRDWNAPEDRRYRAIRARSD